MNMLRYIVIILKGVEILFIILTPFLKLTFKLFMLTSISSIITETRLCNHWALASNKSIQFQVIRKNFTHVHWANPLVEIVFVISQAIFGNTKDFLSTSGIIISVYWDLFLTNLDDFYIFYLPFLQGCMFMYFKFNTFNSYDKAHDLLNDLILNPLWRTRSRTNNFLSTSTI